MSNTNDITGDKIVTKSSKAYADNYDRIFRKRPLLNDDIPKNRIMSKTEMRNWLENMQSGKD